MGKPCECYLGQDYILKNKPVPKNLRCDRQKCRGTGVFGTTRDEQCKLYKTCLADPSIKKNLRKFDWTLKVRQQRSMKEQTFTYLHLFTGSEDPVPIGTNSWTPS